MFKKVRTFLVRSKYINNERSFYLAHPVRVQQIHVYNCTPLINRIMSLIKPFLRPEVAERFQFHAPGSDTLLNFFPREMLPNEYGGSAGPINDVKEFWLKTFIEQR